MRKFLDGINKNILVVDGGTSESRDMSISYGKMMKKVLTELGMNVSQLHLHPNGSWTIDGEVKNVEESLRKTQKVWNCLVGIDGEKAIVESICEKCKVTNIGHSFLHTDLSADKKNLHYALAQHRIKVPYGKVIKVKDYSLEKVKEVFRSVGVPAIVKPLRGANVWGIVVVNNFPDLVLAVESLIDKNMDVLVEKLIIGKHVSCFVYQKNNLFYTSIRSEEEIDKEALMEIRNTALFIHEILAYKHHMEYDFVVSPKGIYFLEGNTHTALNLEKVKTHFGGMENFKDYVFEKLVN